MNAYLGGFGIAAALDAGADVVVTGRVTDAALVVGPAAWWHGWSRDGSTSWPAPSSAGHAIECGAQVTGGNYAFFSEVPGLESRRLPDRRGRGDGSSVITKHEGTGGLVDVGTVTAQLLYEIAGPAYVNPDVVARFDSIRLDQVGANRVRVTERTGDPPPDRLKVAVNYLGGYRNTMTLVLTGLDVPAKADLAQRAVWNLIPGGRDAFDEVDVRLLRADRPDPATEDEAAALLRITVASGDEFLASRVFPAAVVMTGLASYPGFDCTDPPGRARAYSVFWPNCCRRAKSSSG